MMTRLKPTSKEFYPKLTVQHPVKQQGCDVTARLGIATPRHHARPLLSTPNTDSATFIYPEGTIGKR
ncbi:hypothetical protein E2C01_017530 [Portunus trituberculatus]|uniref:Uncharacterized protein n=1 Tax=Portunus trituberculatus TaxID=210409 RepID=A0A5B7DTQ5_PORTR|nr:hypothetical protein [Portunus trituberculatus]